MDRQGRTYDIILLGSGLGGLIAGALLAGKGQSVLLLKERGYQTLYLQKGYRFSPFSNLSEKRLRRSLLSRIYRELGVESWGEGDEEHPVEDTNGSQGKAPLFQVILPEARIDLFSESSRRSREWEREFPGERQRIEAFYKELQEMQALLESRAKRETSPFFPSTNPSFWDPWILQLNRLTGHGDPCLSSFSREFRRFIQLQLGSWGSLDADDFPMMLLAYLLAPKGWEPWATHLDSLELARRITEVFIGAGGEVEEIDRVEKVVRSWRKGFEITLEGDRRRFLTRRLVLNGPLHAFSTLFERGGRIFAKWMDRVHPRYLLFPVFLGIREKVCPVGMGDLLVLLHDLDKTDERGNRLIVALSPKGDESAAPEGMRGLVAQALIPYREKGSVPSIPNDGLIDSLHSFIPFLDAHLEFVEMEWGLEQIGHWSYPHYLYETTVSYDWRRGLVPNRLAKDLFFIGKENFPYLGVEGEVLGGLRVARQIGGTPSKSGPVSS